MATNTYRAQLNYHDSRWGWGNEGTASQGAWDGTGTRTGVLYFPGLASLKSKLVNSVKITVTTGQTGWGLATTKTVSFYRSANQGGIKTSLGASHRTGAAIGSVKGAMYDNTVSYTAAFLAARIAAGDDTYCIYSGSSSTDYLKWTAVTLEVNWSEPATQPSLSSSTVEMGAAVTISTPATNSGYRHTLRYVFGGASGTIAEGVASAHTWTPPVSLASQMPNAASGSGTIYCDTYSGGTLLGTKSVSITLTVPAHVVPTAGTLSASVADDASGTGMYVKGMGKARLTLSGSAGAEGSSIRSTVISGGGWSASGTTLLTGVLTAAGTVTFTATVTDSRGRTASATTSISVIDYTRPGISSCTVYRCDSAGAKQNDGTYAAVELSAFYSAISGNSLSLGVAYKRSSESSYGGSTTLTNNGKTIIGGALSASATYDVRVTVADRYNTVEQVYRLPTKSVLLSFLKNLGAAIGKVAELSGWLDIGLNTRIREDLQVDGAVTLGTALPVSSGGTGAADTTQARWNLEVPTSKIDGANSPDQILESGFYRVFEQEGVPYPYGQMIVAYGGGDTIAQIIIPYNGAFGNPKIRYGNPPSIGGTGSWNGWYDILTSMKPVSIAEGGTGATSAADALGNLGALPRSWVESFTPWHGRASSGNISVANGRRYNYLLFIGEPGAGEHTTTLMVPSQFGGTFQLASNTAFLTLTLTPSGDDVVVSIDSSQYGGALTYVFGGILAR